LATGGALKEGGSGAPRHAEPRALRAMVEAISAQAFAYFLERR
jgi:hypothetical protein